MPLKVQKEHGVFWLSIIGGILLTLLATPEITRTLKPFWIALLIIYWILEAPDYIPLGRVAIIGLLMDLINGVLMGEYALRLIVIAFIVTRIRARMRFFPLPQQALVVFALLLNDRVVQLTIKSFTGVAWPNWTFWLAPLSGMFIWPWLFLMIDFFKRQVRLRDPSS